MPGQHDQRHGRVTVGVNVRSSLVRSALKVLLSLSEDIALTDNRVPDVRIIDQLHDDPAREQGTCLLILENPQIGSMLVAIKSGIRVIVSGDDAEEFLVTAVQAVANRQAFMSPACALPALDWLAGRLMDYRDGARRNADRLTSREREVLEMLGRGLSNSAISAELGTSTATARSHVSHILSKLGAVSRLEAALIGNELRWSTGNLAESSLQMTHSLCV